MKLKVVKRKPGKKKEKEQKPETEVKYLETPYTTAMHDLLYMTGDNLDIIEKELNREPPRDMAYFFHMRDFMHILYRVKLNTLSVEDLSRWLYIVRARIGNPVYFMDNSHGHLFVKSFVRLEKLQDESKLTREAAIAILDGFPIELRQWLYLDDFKLMEVVGKKKKLAKVKSFRKKE